MKNLTHPILRSPDGESANYLLGELNVQRAAAEVWLIPASLSHFSHADIEEILHRLPNLQPIPGYSPRSQAN